MKAKLLCVTAFAAAIATGSFALPAFSAGPAARFEPVHTDPRDLESLQRGAQLFMNYCLGCHSAKYMRYNGLVELGLTPQQISENLIFTGGFEPAADGTLTHVPAKIGDTMQVTMSPTQAKSWFGAPPPDLSVETRVRGTHWVYNYLLAFYRDENSATGWNNLVFPNVGMPHVLWGISGTSRLVTQEFASREVADGAAIAAKALSVVEPAPGGKYVLKTLVLDEKGSLSGAEYRRAVSDLVNFMDYVGEPSKLKRERLGLIVLLFLGVLFVAAYWLKREYWKDVH